MFDRVLYCLNSMKYKLVYRDRLETKGIQCIPCGAFIAIEKGCRIILDKVRLSRNVHLSSSGRGILHIGSGVFFNRNCIVICRDSISIGDNCIFGPNVVIYDHNHKFNSSGIDKSNYSTSKIDIASGCWIGAGVTILKGSKIGEGSVIGAGCIINCEIPPHSLVKMQNQIEITPLYD